MGKQGFTACFDVHSSPRNVFDHITDYDSLDSYNDSIRVAVRGDGKDARCYINIEKRLLDVPARYTARLRFTEFDEPNIIGWKMTKDLDMHGSIEIDEREYGSKVSMDFRIDPDKSDFGTLPAPTGAGFEDILSYLYPKLEGRFAEFLSELVSDIEGEKRKVDITFKNVSDSLDGMVGEG